MIGPYRVARNKPAPNGDTARAGARRPVALLGMADDLARYLSVLRDRLNGGSRKQDAEVLAAEEALGTAIEELKVAHDELEAARAAAEEGQARYHDLFTFAPDAYLVSDRFGRISEANWAAASLLNISNRFVIGKPLQVFVDLADRDHFRTLINTLRYHERVETTVRLARPTRAGPIVNMTAGSVRGADGEFRGIRWLLRDVTEQKRLEAEAAAARDKLRSLASELALTEERERRRVALALHDGLAQDLALAKIKLQNLMSTGGADPRLKEVTELIGHAIGQTRSLTVELSPPILYTLGLEAALEWLSERFQRHGLCITFKSDGKPKTLAEDIQVLLFQAVRELLTNIVKHAAAQRAWVTSRLDEEGLEARVEDDGIGFNVGADADGTAAGGSGASSGLGLFSIRERLRYLGGHVRITSRRGGGTRVTLVVALHAEPAADRGTDPGAEPTSNPKMDSGPARSLDGIGLDSGGTRPVPDHHDDD